MTNKTTPQEAVKLIRFPVKYDENGQMIFDADDNPILDVRGWGRWQRYQNATDIQDAIGQWVANTLNAAKESEESL